MVGYIIIGHDRNSSRAMSSSIGRPDVKAAYRDLDKLSPLHETEQASNVVTKSNQKALAAQQFYKA